MQFHFLLLLLALLALLALGVVFVVLVCDELKFHGTGPADKAHRPARSLTVQKQQSSVSSLPATLLSLCYEHFSPVICS